MFSQKLLMELIACRIEDYITAESKDPFLYSADEQSIEFEADGLNYIVTIEKQ